MSHRESLDRPDRLPPADLAQNLDDLANLKRWSGYDAALWRWLAPVRQAGAPLTLLDVATGGADVPATLSHRANAMGWGLRVVCLDRNSQVAAEARQRTCGLGRIAIIRADALRLPLPDGSVDVALCSFTLHHFAPAEACQLLGELRRVARVGLIVADVTRSRAAYGLAWLALRLWGKRHRISQHDGPLSVRRAYTLPELRRLAAGAELTQPVVVRWLPGTGIIFAPGDAFGRAQPDCGVAWGRARDEPPA